VLVLAMLISGALNIGSAWGMYIARYCVGDESIQSITGILTVLPSVVMGIFIPLLTKKIDKFKLYYLGILLTAVASVAKFFIDYTNPTAFIAVSLLAALPMGLTTPLMFMFTPDCAEYGHYKSGIAAPGITFATQTFFVKLQSAVVASVSSVVLAMIGFVEGEGAVQAAGFADKLWYTSIICPIVGVVIALIILRFYKLNDHDVQLMAKCNAGEITREEAESQMINKY